MLITFISLISVTHSSYLPGTNPKGYKKDDKIKLFVNNLESTLTQLPFEYYYLNFCPPESLIKADENLAEHLAGELIENTPYTLQMQKTLYCEDLCHKSSNRVELKAFEWMIKNQYTSNWVLDNLPAAYRVTVEQNEKNYIIYQKGIPIGFEVNDKVYVYNHLHFIIKVHKEAKKEAWKIVGFQIQPFSIQNHGDSICQSMNLRDLLMKYSEFTEQKLTENEDIQFLHDFNRESSAQELEKEIMYTYSVTFEDSPIPWSSRWDNYLYHDGGEIHWLSILNSFGMVIFLSVMVAHLFRRTVSKDISVYNETIDNDPEADSGWKQLRGDVFRPPAHINFFSVVIGTGIQLILMTLFTVAFACVGFLNPEHRGSLLTIMIFMFAFMGIFAGYSSARLYKTLGGGNWKWNSMTVAFLFPGICFSVFFIINFLIWEEESSGAVDFWSLAELLLIWFTISVPLVFIGAGLGHKKQSILNPSRVTRIPKPIPSSQNIVVYFVCLLSGSLPFGCMFIELNYIMNSMWYSNLFYYLFGFLFLSLIVLTITSAEVSILMTYIVLCREDYRWWWLSFWVSGSSGGYLFAYSMIYYFIKLDITRFSSSVLYFGYMGLISIAYTLVTGTIGFLSTYLFVRKIYSMIKSE
jgi:transmembrane 9 superfamily protein 2/4